MCVAERAGPAGGGRAGSDGCQPAVGCRRSGGRLGNPPWGGVSGGTCPGRSRHGSPRCGRRAAGYRASGNAPVDASRAGSLMSGGQGSRRRMPPLSTHPGPPSSSPGHARAGGRSHRLKSVRHPRRFALPPFQTRVMSAGTSIGPMALVAVLTLGASHARAQQPAVCHSTPGDGERIECTEGSTSTDAIDIVARGVDIDTTAASEPGIKASHAGDGGSRHLGDVQGR